MQRANRPSARTDAAPGALSGRVQSVVTVQYLNNVRITITGTDLVAFTDNFGLFRLAQVPGGKITLEAFCSGLDPRQITPEMAPGESREQNLILASRAPQADQPGVVKLNPFVLTASKLTEGEALATNGQRFAPNIKNVVATDAIGDLPPRRKPPVIGSSPRRRPPGRSSNLIHVTPHPPSRSALPPLRDAATRPLFRAAARPPPSGRDRGPRVCPPGGGRRRETGDVFRSGRHPTRLPGRGCAKCNDQSRARPVRGPRRA